LAIQEYQFCRTKGNQIALPLSLGAMLKVLAEKNAHDAAIVFKECIEGRSSAWFFKIEVKDVRLTRMIPSRKKTPSEETIKLMIEGYQESANEDLIIAKEFEEVENELDDDCDTKR